MTGGIGVRSKHGLIALVLAVPVALAGIPVYQAQADDRGGDVSPSASQVSPTSATPPAIGGATDSALAAVSTPDPVPLLELTTSSGIHFVTLSRSESDLAVAKHGFTRKGGTAAYLMKTPFSGSQPLYRLARSGTAGWLVTASTSERDSLVRAGTFRYEGILGHAATAKVAGTALLSRFSNGREWRLAMESPDGKSDELLAAGYRRDGPLGYVYPRWVRAGALYFGTWNSGTNPVIISGGYDVFRRTYDDWWAGVRDYSGQDPDVPQYKGAWPNDDFSDRKPAIGFYDDSQTATAESHISQASSAGLDYFAFYWYWNSAKSAESYGAGLQSFLRASNRNSMDFALTLCAHSWDNGTLKIPTSQYGVVGDRLVDSYLSQPNYLRANDGRRIVWLCDSRGIGSGSNSDVKAFVDILRSKAKARFGDEILVLAHQDLGLDLAAVGADGDYCAAPYRAVQNRTYAGYVEGQRTGFARGSSTFVRCVMSDFDERTRHPISKPDPATAAYFPDQSFDLFKQAARNAAADIAVSARTSVVDNFVLVYAWNEWNEGGYIEPNDRDGCRYLDILRHELALVRGSGCVARPSAQRAGTP